MKVTGVGTFEDRLKKLEQANNFGEVVLCAPLVGSEDATGGAGTVTSIAGGVGITNSPEPITTIGTVDLDLHSLTTETASASGDLFGMVDVSVGTSIAAQRKITRANVLGTELEALRAFGSTGLLARTGAGTYAARTLTQPAAGLTVADGDGVAGNPTLALANDLAALEGLASTGFAARTTTDTWAQRTLTAPAAGLTISNPAGIAGNPTFALANDLSALEGLGSTGIAVRTTTDTWAQRTLQAPAAGFTITNPAGVAGDPTFVLANDLAALEAMSSTGLVARTGSETYAQRTLTGPAAGISVTNGDGVSGNPTLALANDLSALEGLGSTGIAVRSASDTWVQRTIVEGVGTLITDGDGVAGNPTIDLDINDLTAETTSAAGDLFAFVDVSVGSTVAAQRKMARSDLLGTTLETLRAITLGSGVATWLETPSSANLAAAVTDETGTGALVFGTAPTFTTSIITPIVYGSASSTGGLTLRANDDDFLGTITINSSVDSWPGFGNYTAGSSETRRVSRFNPSFTATPTGGTTQHALYAWQFDPTITSAIGITGDGLTVTGFRFDPTATMGTNTAIQCVLGAGTYTNTAVQFLGTFQLFTGTPTLRSATAGVAPYGPVIFSASPSVTYDINNGGAAVVSEVLDLLCGATITCAQGGTSQLTVTELNAIRIGATFVETAGTLICTTRRGIKYAAVSVTNSPAITTDCCIDIADTDVATVGDALSLRSAGATVEMRHAGPARFGSSSAGPTGGSIVHVDGGFTVKRTTFSNAAYAMLTTDFYVAQVGTMSASRTVTLPAAATAAAGKFYVIKDASGSVTGANDIVVDGNGAELIDGAASKTIDSAYGSLTLICDGTGWQVVAHEGTIV